MAAPVSFPISAYRGTDHLVIIDIVGGDYSNREFQLRFSGEGWPDVTGEVARIGDDTRIVFTLPGYGVGLRMPISYQIWLTDYPRQVLAAGAATCDDAFEAEVVAP